MAITIRHDGFARASLMREKCPAGEKCKWCGQAAKWAYYWRADDNLSPLTARYGVTSYPFCGIDCYRTYNA